MASSRDAIRHHLNFLSTGGVNSANLHMNIHRQKTLESKRVCDTEAGQVLRETVVNAITSGVIARSLGDQTGCSFLMQKDTEIWV